MLRVTVSKSAFSMDTNAATGFPSAVRITGSLFTSRAYSASGAVAFAISSIFITQLCPGQWPAVKLSAHVDDPRRPGSIQCDRATWFLLIEALVGICGVADVKAGDGPRGNGNNVHLNRPTCQKAATVAWSKRVCFTPSFCYPHSLLPDSPVAQGSFISAFLTVLSQLTV